ncbi:hypothetical protein DY000_02009352 [Brassica cretica]|uniref:NB-ARC domain-containing protein n=1 Tax=Brassica cretica TaxID=69181 RepID=A0ABQ7CIQ3_BRACR|nr:hypothetical protein DY000_02009352 [Brassica cretica]
MDSYFSLTNIAAAAAISFCALFGTMFFNRKSRSHQENKAMASSSLTLPSPPSSLPRNWIHHAFPSFHGADVHENFLSHLVKEKTEVEMIAAIVIDVLNKLNLSAPCSDFDSLVGMESHMTIMGPLLRLDFDEVRKIGILGPPGIGKTAIARSLFIRYSQDFQLSVFIDNIKTKYAIPASSDDYSKDPKDGFGMLACEVINPDSGSVVGIDLNEDIACTSERAFERLSNLQFLRIFSKGVNPQKFLVKLQMQDTKLEKLWEGIKPLNNLKWMDLRNSSNLKELADLSTATNLQELNLSYCSRLEELPDLSTATNLQELNLSYCSRLEELPDLSTATNLQKLNLSYCSRLVELSLSIGNAINLQKLDLSHCSRLVKLSLSIGNVINLQKLDLSHCSRLVELSSSIGSAVNLQEINLEYCSSLVRLPFSFENAVNLESMNLKYCSSLVELPFSMRNLGRLSKLELKGCSMLEVNQANINLESLDELDLSDCSSLKSYHESSTDIQELDPWIGRISRLQKLVLNGMKKLTSLQQLPDSVVELDASHCFSLERLDCTFCNPGIHLNFKSCFELNQEAIDLIIHTPMMNITEMNIIWKTEFTNHGRL